MAKRRRRYEVARHLPVQASLGGGQLLNRIAERVHDVQGEHDSSSQGAELFGKYVVKVHDTGAGVLIQWSWREARKLHHLWQLPLYFIPGPVACTLEVSYHITEFEARIRLRCPAHDLFAIRLRESLEATLESFRQHEVYVPGINEPEWIDRRDAEIDDWRDILEDTNWYRKPKWKYRFPKRRMHEVARDILEMLERHSETDTGFVERLGIQPIVPRSRIRLSTEYHRQSLTPQHIRRYHPAKEENDGHDS